MCYRIFIQCPWTTRNAPFLTTYLLKRQAIPQIRPVKPITDIKLMIIIYNTLHSERIKDHLLGYSNSIDIRINNSITSSFRGDIKLTFWGESSEKSI